MRLLCRFATKLGGKTCKSHLTAKRTICLKLLESTFFLLLATIKCCLCHKTLDGLVLGSDLSRLFAHSLAVFLQASRSTLGDVGHRVVTFASGNHETSHHQVIVGVRTNVLGAIFTKELLQHSVLFFKAVDAKNLIGLFALFSL